MATHWGSGGIAPPLQWVSGVFSLGVKGLKNVSGHSPPSSAEIKNAWSYTSIHGVVLS
jgi:hypothetical protein